MKKKIGWICMIISMRVKTLPKTKTTCPRIERGPQDETIIFISIFFVSFSLCEVGDERDFGPWSRWSACSQFCGSGGVRYRVRACIRDGDCKGQTLHMSACYKPKCYCKFQLITIIDNESVGQLS